MSREEAGESGGRSRRWMIRALEVPPRQNWAGRKCSDISPVEEKVRERIVGKQRELVRSEGSGDGVLIITGRKRRTSNSNQ